MKIMPKLAGLLALGLTLGVARADTFTFSYVFGDGLEVTGSLDGTLSGIFVADVTNVSVFFGPDALPGTVFASQYDGSSYQPGPIVSFDVFQNNFAFANSDLAGVDFTYDSIFYIFNASVFSDTAVAFSTLGYASQDDPTEAARWTLTLTSTAAVPDQGATLVLLGLGLAGLGWRHRRVRSVTSVR